VSSDLRRAFPDLACHSPIAAMAAETAVAVNKRSRSIFTSSLEARQNDLLQSLVTKYRFQSTEEFTRTSTDRDILHWEHGHLATALDTLNSYQKKRRARSVGMSMQKQYKKDPRTRFVELLKQWLRTHANNKSLNEDEVRRFCSLCRGIMDHQQLFASRNTQSFMHTIADVYKELQMQLREVLEKDRTCAELAEQVLSKSRNFISDAIGYLLVAPTDLKQTDKLRSLEAVSLLTTLPAQGHPLPARVDPSMQHEMRDAWGTHCGSLVAALLRTRESLRLFEGASAQEEADANAAAIQDMADGSPKAAPLGMLELLEKVRTEQSNSNFKTSGLAGPFRKKEASDVREKYLTAVEFLYDLIYLLGEAFVHFKSISDGLGDYGMIRVAVALHPFLGAILEKVHALKKTMESLNEAVDRALVLPAARRESIPKPVPSEHMRKRAHEAMERAISHTESHVHLLVKAIEDLKARSQPDRLPQVMNCIANACVRLDAVLSSPQFRACVGDSFPSLPRLTDVTQERTPPTLQILDAATSTRYDSDVKIEDITPTPPASFMADASPRTAASFWDAATPPDVPGGMPGTGSVAPARSPRCRPPAPMQQQADFCVSRPVAKAPLQSTAELSAEVYRLNFSQGCGSLRARRHDRRCLRLASDSKNRYLEICGKNSSTNVKTVVDLAGDVEECCMLSDRVMSLIIRRVPQNAAKEHGVFEMKEYRFEFLYQRIAEAFHKEISRGQ